MNKISIIDGIMRDFVERTGLEGEGKKSQRYLWTDAFAVCNFLELFQQTGEEYYLKKALDLVDEVHHILGRHREDDRRSGWISGLDEQEGAVHPCIGGLRIGKRLNERKETEAYDEYLEWEQDGQYFHYLTKWMHALSRVTQVTGNQRYNRWAIELAKAAHLKFSYTLQGHAEKRLYWKMSIDLSRPLVSSMGQHDALDAFITYHELATTAANDRERSEEVCLSTEIVEALSMCHNMHWLTDDPLGIGGLLSDACRATQLIANGSLEEEEMLLKMLHAAKEGLEAFLHVETLSSPREFRLAFRELGLSIGLAAIQKIRRKIQENPDRFVDTERFYLLLDELNPYLHLHEAVNNFWLAPENQKNTLWRDHSDINSVMLATSFAPDAYLNVFREKRVTDD
ncbi:MAG: hypothetical protein U9Q90_02380 [Campylobacterota bacterium]|nr:hypothetical protein [Campylobacterota bacterium]